MFEKNRFLCLINDYLHPDEKKFSDLISKLKDDRKIGNDDDLVDDEIKINSLGDLNHVFKASLFENLVKLFFINFH